MININFQKIQKSSIELLKWYINCEINAMNHLFPIIFLIFSLTVSGQSEQIIGVYEKRNEHDDRLLFYKLTLNSDGSFIFHSYDKNYSWTSDLTNERNKYGKGTWKAEKNLVYFYSDKRADFDEKYSLDFSYTKARFITKSPRDKSDRVIKTALLFYESDIFWVERWKLFKLE